MDYTADEDMLPANHYDPPEINDNLDDETTAWQPANPDKPF